MSNHWAELNRQVVFGESDGRIIWQPRIGCWMVDKLFAGRQLPAPYTGMELPAIYRSLNCSARTYQWFNPCFTQIEPDTVIRRERKLNHSDIETVIESVADASGAGDIGDGFVKGLGCVTDGNGE